MRYLLLCAALLAGCTARSRPSTAPLVRPSGDPREQHVLDETARFASMLGVNVRGILTTYVYNVRCSDGAMCPAAGWYADGRVYFWRPAILRNDEAYGTALAAHEACHAIHHGEAEADTCAATLLAQ